MLVPNAKTTAHVRKTDAVGSALPLASILHREGDRGSAPALIRHGGAFRWLCCMSLVLAAGVDSGLCEAGPAAETSAHAEAAGDECSLCDRFVVSRGFDLGWLLLNHRISLWDMRPDQASCPTQVPEDVQLQLGYIGGDYTTDSVVGDRPFFAYDYTALTTDCAAAFVSGTATFDLGPDNREDFYNFSLDWSEFADTGTTLALIQGVRIVTDHDTPFVEGYEGEYNPADGYTMSGLGAWIKELSLNGGELSGTVWAHFQPAPTIEFDRPDMDEAIEYAIVHLEVDYVLIWLEEGWATSQEYGYVLDYGDSPSHTHLPHASEAERQIEVYGDNGRYPLAFVGLVGFNFDLYDEAAGLGDYIRELSVRTKLIDYSMETGIATVDVDGYASNSSILVHEPMVNDFSAEIALVQLARGNVQARQAHGIFETGETVVGLE